MGDAVDFSDSLDEWEAPIANSNTEDDAKRQEEAAKNTALIRDDEGERELAGDEVTLSFTLPNKSIVQHTFYMGQTIEVVKMFLEKGFGLEYERTSLYLDDLLLMDPLSIVDLPFKAKSVNHVRVEVTPAA